MERYTRTPRETWVREVEAVGFTFHTVEATPYWDESAYWRFTGEQVDQLEAAAERLHVLCLQAVQHVIERRLFALFDITPEVARLIERSWSVKEPSVYGRFDLAYDGTDEPKLLEYNADTPTSLFESSIVQWQWQQAVFPDADQFNSIHEGLVQRWRDLRLGRHDATSLHLASLRPHPEDEITVQYMAATAIEAGYNASVMAIEDLGWNADERCFTDMSERRIKRLFKLYPWEWLVRDAFGKSIPGVAMDWFEPAWKMLLSNKAILPVLWEMFPHHPNLLPAFRDRAELIPVTPFVEKPILGREGANIRLFDARGNSITETTGAYGDQPTIFQAMADNVAQVNGGGSVVLGLWMVNDKCRGLGIREDAGPITRNTSRFVPHIFE